MHKLLRIIPLLSLFALIGCDEQRPEPNPAVLAGEAIFMDNCSRCHPRTGRGDYLKKIPVSLLIMKSEHELKAWIRGSEKHREMPNFDNLSEDELAALASYLHNEISK
ncbi:MAG: cytochrome c [Porticoccaceae bacterium]|nr:cytochrome c [Pseudomonadales bacterium]MCP5170939.1 cytochrome c [Pseudomonadales bacterium]MCP5301821.1 cytochrome c [Pseudomonadales bacterium]